jgi:DNA mismatch endonuclease, patch repair protein
MMAGIRSKNTKPEIGVRKLLHRLGFRFRLHRKDLPGKPDIVLPKWNAAVFVHGCFWHGHANCPLYRLPLSNADFWSEKIGGNMIRDAKGASDLLASGWRVITVWECALKGKSALPLGELTRSLDRTIRNHEVVCFDLRGATQDHR